MLQDLLHLLTPLRLSTISELWQQTATWLSQWDSGAIGSSGAALALGALWFFARVIRKTIGLLFMICVIYLTLRYACGIDLLQLLPGSVP